MNRITFNGFTFPYNPETYESIMEKKTVIHNIPGSSGQVQVVCFAPRKISGSGAFVNVSGENFRTRMFHLFLIERSSVLKLPNGETINAYFIGLKMVGDGKSGLLRYEFSFIEDTGSGVSS